MKIFYHISEISLVICLSVSMTDIVCAQNNKSAALQETIRATAVGEISTKNPDNLEKSVLLNRSWSTGETLNRPGLSVPIWNQENLNMGGANQKVASLDAEAPLLNESVLNLEMEMTAIVAPETQEKGWFGRFMDAGGAVKDSVVGGLIDVAWLGSHSITNKIDDLRGQTPIKLTMEQKVFAKKLYGESLDIDAIVIRRGSLMDNISPCPHVSGNTIYMTDTWGGVPLFDEDGALTKVGMDIVNHEIAHVWQYQNGGSDYINKALSAQGKSEAETGSRNGAYRWRKFYRAGVSFEKLNPEAQATLIEEIGDVSLNGARTSLEKALAKVNQWSFDEANSQEVDKIINEVVEEEEGKSEEFKKELAYMLNAWANVRNGLGAP